MGDNFYQMLCLFGDLKYNNFVRKHEDFDKQFYSKRLKHSFKKWDRNRQMQEFKDVDTIAKSVKPKKVELSPQKEVLPFNQTSPIKLSMSKPFTTPSKLKDALGIGSSSLSNLPRDGQSA